MPSIQASTELVTRVQALGRTARALRPRASEQLSTELLAVLCGMKQAAMVDSAPASVVLALLHQLEDCGGGDLLVAQLGDCAWLLRPSLLRAAAECAALGAGPRFICLDADELCWADAGAASSAAAACGASTAPPVLRRCRHLTAATRQRLSRMRCSPPGLLLRRPCCTACYWATPRCCW